MYVFIYLSIQIWYIYLYISEDINLHIYKSIYTYIYIKLYKYIHIHKYTYVFIFSYIYIYVYNYINKYIYICTYIYILFIYTYNYILIYQRYIFTYIKVYTWCNNLIPGTALWMQNLFTCSLAAAVAFEILSFWRYALRETVVPLPETVLKIVFRNTSQ